LRRRALRLARSFTSPLLPDDYLELVDPLWTTRELRGRVQRIERASSDAVTIFIKPGWEWPGHRPGQYLRLGIEVAGRHHWRAYSLTSEPDRADGCISITPKLVPTGAVSPYLCERLRPGAIVRLGGVQGSFTLPERPPARLLFVSAGSGITPIASMLRSLPRGGGAPAVLHIHSTRTPEQFAFARELRELDRARPGYRLHEWISSRHGRLTPDRLDELCHDWAERETFLCGPAGLLEAMSARWQRDGDSARLHVEHFQPHEHAGEGERGSGGTIRLRASDLEAVSDGQQPILLAGEQAGASMPFGCRMGICHSCVGRLRSGRVRDLRTGRVHGQPGELVQTCINAPEGAIEIDL
jgi:ferredoxin-NADP reductase